MLILKENSSMWRSIVLQFFLTVTIIYFLGWGKKKFGRLPVDTFVKQRLVYYLIGPDNIEGCKEKWMEQRDGDGEVVFSKYYWDPRTRTDDRLILQKRICKI